MAADSLPRPEGRTPRYARAAIWPWLLMPLIVLAVFCALLRLHHQPGTPWASWSHTASDESAPSPRQP